LAFRGSVALRRAGLSAVVLAALRAAAAIPNAAFKEKDEGRWQKKEEKRKMQDARRKKAEGRRKNIKKHAQNHNA